MKINDKTETIEFDSSDYIGMLKLMKDYGDSLLPFYGKNQDDEDIEVHIFKDKIITIVYQQNKWVRKNIYRDDGNTEELFEGRWK